MPSSSSSGKGLVAQGQHVGAHRIADQMRLAAMLRFQALRVGKAGGDRFHPARQQAVDPARAPRSARAARRAARPIARPAGWAARGSRRSRPPRWARPSRTGDAPSPGRAMTARAPPSQRSGFFPNLPGGKDMRGQEIGLAGNVGPAPVGHQRDVMTAPMQFRRQREGGDQMPARPSGGEHVMPRRTGARRAVRSAHGVAPAGWARARSPGVSRPRYGFRRVMASSSPTVRQVAMVEEPP